MELWMLYNKEENYEVKKIREACNKEGIDVTVYNPNDFDIFLNREDRKSILVKGEKVKLPDILFPRMGATTTYFGLSVIRHMERLGVPVINTSDSIMTVKDKLFTSQVLAEKGLPIPNTLLLKQPFDLKFVEKELGYPVVIKVLEGSQGKGVFLVNNKKELLQLTEIIETTKPTANFILQEFMSDSYGKDIRVYVLGGKIVASMVRKSNDENEFRANISNGGVGEKFKMTKEVKKICMETVKTLNLDLAGVDLLFDKEGYKICEVNSNPGFKGLEQATGIDVATIVAKWIKNKIINKK